MIKLTSFFDFFFLMSSSLEVSLSELELSGPEDSSLLDFRFFFLSLDLPDLHNRIKLVISFDQIEQFQIIIGMVRKHNITINYTSKVYNMPLI